MCVFIVCISLSSSSCSRFALSLSLSFPFLLVCGCYVYVSSVFVCKYVCEFSILCNFCILRQLFGAPFFKTKQIINTTKPTISRATFYSFFSPSPLQPGLSRFYVSVVFRSGSTLPKKSQWRTPRAVSLTSARRYRGARHYDFLQCILRLKSLLMLI